MRALSRWVAGVALGLAVLFMPAAAASAPAAANFHTITPCRIFDSRTPADAPPLAHGVARLIQVTSLVTGPCAGAVPSTASSIAANMTAINATADGDMVLYPGDVAAPGPPRPGAMPFKAGKTRSKIDIVHLAFGGGGNINALATMSADATTDLILDVTGYFVNDITPVAVNDTKTVVEDDPAATIDVRANDTDSDGGLKVINSVQNPSTQGGTVLITNAGNDLTYEPAADYCNDPPGTSPDTFTYTLNGGSTATVTVTVTCANDAPAGTDGAVNVAEDTDHDFDVADFGFTDPDDTPPNGLLAVKITTLPGAGSLTLDGNPVVAGQFIPVADIANGDLEFAPAAGATGTPYASFTFQVQDDGGTAIGGVDLDPSPNTITINVNDANDPPVGTDNTVSTDEDTDYVFATADFGFTDPNDTPADSLFAVKITTLPGAGTLTLSAVPVVAGQGIAVAQIPNLKFTPTVNANGAPYTSFTFQVQDDGGTTGGGVDLDASPNTMTVNITSVNDAPAGTDNTVTTGEDVDYVFTTGDFGFTDPNDTPADTLFAVKVTTLPAAGGLTLSGVPVVAGQDIPVAGITGGNLKFTPAAGASGAPYTSFTFQVQDNGGTTAGGVDLDPTPKTMTVNVNDVNDAPAGTDNAVTTNEGTDYMFAVIDFGFTDPNDTPAAALLAVKLTTLPATGSLTLSGGAVALGQFIAVADITAGDLKFTPTANGFGAPFTTFTFQVQDDGGVLNGGVDLDPSANTVTINVTAINDAPAGTNNTVVTNEDIAYTFAAADFGFTDPTDTPADDFFAVKITTLPGAGALTLSAVPVAAGQNIPVAQIPNLVFTPAANANGSPYTTFTFQVQDDGGVLNGGVDLDPSANTMTINVNSVNDAPAGTNNTVTTDEDVQYTFTLADFGFTDPNDSPANAFSSVIVNSPTAGSLTLTGEVTAAQITANLLKFTPAANAFGSPYATFTFQVRDNGGVASGGVDLDPSANTMTVNVLAVNDAPTVLNETFHVIGNTELRVDMTAGTTPHASETTAGASAYEGVLDNDGDVEGDVVIVSAVGSGCTDLAAPFDCTLTSGAVVHVDANGEFSFTPGPGDTGDSFQYTITDQPSVGTPLSAVGAVTFTFFEMVWYVDNSGGAGNGTSIAPFNAITGTNIGDTSGDSDLTDDLDDASDYIFVDFGTGTDANQTTGLQLEVSQHLLGEFAGLSIPVNLNGNGSPTVLVVPPGATDCSGGPCRPLLSNAAGSAVTASDNDGVAAPAIGTIPVEIVGMSLQGSVNAIDLTTTAALSGSSTLTILQNVFRGAGAEGIDVNLNTGTTGTLALTIQTNSWNTAGTHTGNAVDINRTAGTLALVFSENSNLVSAATAVNIAGGADATLTTITGFANNSVHQNTGGSGIVVTNTEFDTVAGGAYGQVSGGTTVIGASGDGVGGSGMSLTGVAGDLAFSDLDIFASNGAGLVIVGTGAVNVGTGTGTRVTVGAGVSIVEATGGPALSLTSMTGDFQLITLKSTNSTSTGASLVSYAGTVSAGDGSSISAPSGTAFNVSSSAPTVTYAGSITASGSRAVAISNAAAAGCGTRTFSGAINGSGASASGILVNNCNAGTTTFSGSTLTLSTQANHALTLTGNAGATINFSGGDLALTTTTGRGLLASGGGAINVTGANNTINTTNGTAFEVFGTAGVHMGGGYTFKSISSANGTKGISLQFHDGPFTVTGDGADAGTLPDSLTSGGTISNITNRGAELIDVSGAISLGGMTFTNATTANGAAVSVCGLPVTGDTTQCNAPLHLVNTPAGVTLTTILVNGSAQHGINANNVTNLTMTSVEVTGAGNETDESGVMLTNVKGTGSITSCNFHDNHARALHLTNTNGTLAALPIKGTTFSNSSNNQGLLVAVYNAGTVANVAVGGTLAGEPCTFANTFGNGFEANASSSASLTFSVKGSSITNTNGVVAANAASGTIDSTVQGNTFIAGANTGAGAISIASSNGGALTVDVLSNTIGSAVAGSGSACAGCNGMFINPHSTGATNIEIRGNVIQNVNGGGIIFRSGNVAAGYNHHVFITGNVIRDPGPTAITSNLAVEIRNGITSGPPEDSGCLAVTLGGATNYGGASPNADAMNIFEDGWNGAGADIFLFTRFATTTKLPSYAAPFDTYVRARNSVPPAPGSTVSSLHQNTSVAIAGTGCP